MGCQLFSCFYSRVAPIPNLDESQVIFVGNFGSKNFREMYSRVHFSYQTTVKVKKILLITESICSNILGLACMNEFRWVVVIVYKGSSGINNGGHQISQLSQMEFFLTTQRCQTEFFLITQRPQMEFFLTTQLPHIVLLNYTTTPDGVLLN